MVIVLMYDFLSFTYRMISYLQSPCTYRMGVSGRWQVIVYICTRHHRGWSATGSDSDSRGSNEATKGSSIRSDYTRSPWVQFPYAGCVWWIIFNENFFLTYLIQFEETNLGDPPLSNRPCFCEITTPTKTWRANWLRFEITTGWVRVIGLHPESHRIINCQNVKFMTDNSFLYIHVELSCICRVQTTKEPNLTLPSLIIIHFPLITPIIP